MKSSKEPPMRDECKLQLEVILFGVFNVQNSGPIGIAANEDLRNLVLKDF